MLLWEGSSATPLRALLRQAADESEGSVPFSLSVLSGPEVGFTESELAIATVHRIALASLGPRTLRAETAPLAAAAAALFEHGDLD